MKKLIILILAIVLLGTGSALADTGLDPVPETQGITSSTTANIVGNFASATELQWRITNVRGGLTGGIPLDEYEKIYESTYTEDTQSDGIGLMLYDKEFDVETSGQITGQWNIEATKQIAFIGIDAASVVSSDTIMVDGAAADGITERVVICPFAEDVARYTPAFCNRAEAGSTIDMTVANVRTTTTDRFIMPSADHPVELNHDIRVSELVTDVPSQGMASAYLDVLVQEARVLSTGGAGVRTLMERIEFSEETSSDGAITLFDKLMHYESGMVR